MAEDIATLAIEVESKGVSEAAGALGSLSESAEKAGESVSGTSGAVAGLVQSLKDSGLSADEMKDALRNLGFSAKDTKEAIQSIGTGAVEMSNQAVAALDKVSAAAEKTKGVLAARLDNALSGFQRFQVQGGINNDFGFGGGGGDDDEGGPLAPFNKSMKSSINGMGIWRAAFIAFMAKSFVEAIVQGAEAGEKIKEMADAAGFGVESFQKLGFAAANAGVDQQKFNTALDFFEKSIGQAKDGNKEMQRAFSETGVSLHDLFALNPEQVFNAVSTSLGSMGDQARAQELTMKEFGRTSRQMIDVFREGPDAIKAYGIEAERLGGILTDNDVAASKEVTAQFREFEQVLSVDFERAAIAVAPGIVYIANKIRDLAGDLHEAAEAWNKFVGAGSDAASVQERLNHDLEIKANIQKGGFIGAIDEFAFGDHIDKDIATEKDRLNTAQKLPGSLNTTITEGGTPVSDINSARDAIKELVEQDRERSKAAQQGAGGLAAYNAEQKIYNELTKRGIELTAENKAKFADLVAEARAAAAEPALNKAAIKNENRFEGLVTGLQGQIEKQEAMTAALEQGKSAVDGVRVAQDALNALARSGVKITDDQRDSYLKLVSQLDSAKQKYDDLKAAIAANTKEYALFQAVTNSGTTESEKKLRDLNQLRDDLIADPLSFGIDPSQTNEMLVALGQVNDAIKKVEDSASRVRKVPDHLASEFGRAFDTMADKITNSLLGLDKSKKSFGDQIKGLVQELDQFAVKFFVVQPLLQSVNSAGHDAFPHLFPAPDPQVQKDGIFGGGTGLKGLFEPIATLFSPITALFHTSSTTQQVAASTQQTAATTHQVAATTQQTAATSFLTAVGQFVAAVASFAAKSASSGASSLSSLAGGGSSGGLGGGSGAPTGGASQLQSSRDLAGAVNLGGN